MSNPWSGMIAKTITSKKRSRLFWNLFFYSVIFVIALAMSVFVYQIVSDHSKYDEEQIFIEYKNGYLITDIASFKTPKNEEQEINIKTLIQSVNSGDKICLTISKVSGDLLEVKHNNNSIYKKATTPILPTVLASFILVFPILGFCIFMLFVVNIKNPSEKIDKIQRRFLLRK